MAKEREDEMEVIMSKMPENLAEFKGMAQMDLTKPENTASLFLCALYIFSKDKAAGVEAINLLKGPVALNAHEVSFLTDRLRDKLYLPLVYFEGAKPENNYSPNQPLSLKFLPDPRPQDCEEGYIRLYLKTAGADAPRAIKMRRKGDNWYLWEYPGIVMDVRKPVQEDPWA